MSLREISEQTRITIRHLEAIEADDHKNLPGGIFNRSFVKAYARQIGFGEQRALDLYNRAALTRGEAADDPGPVVHRPRVYTDGGEPRSPALTLLLSVVIVGILILVIYAALHYYRRTGEQAAGAAATAPADAGQAPPQNAAQPPPAPSPAPELAGFKIQVRAKDKGFWLTSREDEAKSKGRILSAGKTEEFEPQGSLYLLVERAALDSLEVAVNGRVLKPPADAAGSEVAWLITKDNFRQYLP